MVLKPMLNKHEPSSSRVSDILRHYIEDIVYGANDGIITTFAVVSGVQGAKLSPLVLIILGFVSLFADGVSMGASRYLSIRAGAAVRNVNRGYLEPAYHGTCTFLAFIIFGFFPLFSFLIPQIDHYRFLISCIITALVLFVVGSLRFFVSKKHWLQGGVEMLLIGGVVAIIAYGVGYFIKDLV
jgi:VIT1/CCC1 family predicted Fe2+/Mn2+ transporter